MSSFCLLTSSWCSATKNEPFHLKIKWIRFRDQRFKTATYILSVDVVSVELDFLCYQLRIWSHLLEKSLLENFIFCAVKLPLFNKRICTLQLTKQSSASTKMLDMPHFRFLSKRVLQEFQRRWFLSSSYDVLKKKL